jgi:hypothetical protein
MNIIMLFTVYCAKCRKANDWNIDEPTPRVTTPNSGFRVECVWCNHAGIYHHTEIMVTQMRR